MIFDKTKKELFFSKNDARDMRLGDYSKPFESAKIFEGQNKKAIPLVILGYPDDEGIDNNGGRIGASKAPYAIRKHLYKMTPHVLMEKELHLYDGGNLVIEGSLFERHEHVATHLESLLSHTNVISLGGGHDYGYADGKAFLHKFSEQKPLIINFDAHLDVRPMPAGQEAKITSGTPFYRLLSEFSNFDFLEVGIQSQCNSRPHMEWALAKNTKIMMWDEVLYSGKNFVSKVLEFFEPYLLKRRPTYLSIDIDSFSSAYAPGASQVFSTGFTPENFFPVFKVLCQRLDVKLLGIYEVSPPLDMDERTSKLAAQIVFERIFA